MPIITIVTLTIEIKVKPVSTKGLVKSPLKIADKAWVA